jgi:hypothetical protein
MAKRASGGRKAIVAAVAVTFAFAGFAVQACDDDSDSGTVTPQPDGAAPQLEAATSFDGTAFDATPTGDVKGNINYLGAKRGTVVIAFLDKIPSGPPDPANPPKVGGFALSNPSTFPGTFATKVAPGTWQVSAYMSVGQPPHLDGPVIGPGGIPMEPVGAPAQVEVKAGETANVDLMLIDIEPPPPGDGGAEAGDAGEDADAADNM